MISFCFLSLFIIYKKAIKSTKKYNAINVYCRELAPGAVSLTGDRAQGDDNKHCRDYTILSSYTCNPRK